MVARIENILRKTRFIVLGIAIVSTLANIAFLSVLIAQRYAPYQYNEWVDSHRYVRLVETKEPTLQLGNEWKTVELNIRDFGPMFYDDNLAVWSTDEGYFDGIVGIDNPSRISFYVHIVGHAGIRLENEVDWSDCKLVEGYTDVYELGASCAMYLENPSPGTTVYIQYDKPPKK